ncbi:hypothetical protein ACSVIJ_12585 [Pseudomonas sp. NCHU5208]|uniref:hypothetical protein n=1 Tax=unclassified Pseudomonas TaxID=196821 RepID=UPI003F9DB02C
MDEFKLTVDQIDGSKIDKDIFEEQTRCREPWYQPGTMGRDSHFAVCPACDNPIQLIGLYELPPNVQQPFGKHMVTGVKGIAPLDDEAKENCPYFNPRQHDKSSRKARFDGVPRKIVKLLIEHFDRVAYILEKQTGLVLSTNALGKMLDRYVGERGFMYSGATLRNVPWVFAYMSNATDLFNQRVSGNSALVEAIRQHVPGADISKDGRLISKVPADDSKPIFFDLKVNYLKHRFSKTSNNAGITERMVMNVSLKVGGGFEDIHQEAIDFDYSEFDRLIRIPEGKGHRRMHLVELAKQKLGHLLQ